MSSEFCKEVLSWLKDNNIVIESFTEISLFLGFFDETGKYYIYVRKYHGSMPSLRGFITRIKSVYNIELHIARERDKLAIHFKKWEKLVIALNNE